MIASFFTAHIAKVHGSHVAEDVLNIVTLRGQALNLSVCHQLLLQLQQVGQTYIHGSRVGEDVGLLHGDLHRVGVLWRGKGVCKVRAEC